MRELRFAAPLPVHIPFHDSTANVKCAIGGVGSGKSRALCMEAHRFALAQPGSDMILTRESIPTLRRSTEVEYFEAMPPGLREACDIKRLGGHVDTVTYPNGSRLQLLGLDDWNKYKSMNLAWIGIDEASEQTQTNFEGILTRMRQPRPLGDVRLPRGQKMRHQCVLASNPAGQDWLWSQFVNKSSRRGDSSIHLSTPMDNPYLSPEYLELLMQMPPPAIRRFVFCQFDAAAGRIYEEWGWDSHVVPIAAPGIYGRAVWQGMDPGTLSPTAAVWCELDRANGRLVAVAEYQEPGRSVPEHVAAWRRMEAAMAPARVIRRIADPAISKRDAGTNMELADIYARNGYSFSKGPVAEATRIDAMAALIATRQFVCTEATPLLFDQINNARWQDQVPRLRDLGEFQEKRRKGNDHVHDASQYIATQYAAPLKAKAEVEPDTREMLNDVERERWMKERAPKRRTAAPGCIV